MSRKTIGIIGWVTTVGLFALAIFVVQRMTSWWPLILVVAAMAASQILLGWLTLQAQRKESAPSAGPTRPIKDQ